MRWAVVAAAGCGAALTGGCALPGPAPRAAQLAIADAARPILQMDPDAVWSEAYNRLVEFGPAGIEYLMQQPAMTNPVRVGDLRPLLHTSLIRLLAAPESLPPRLSASALETTLGVLHFDVKVGGHRLGQVAIRAGTTPRTWLDLFPADFDHALAMMIDVEGDRRALRAWWAAQRGGPAITTRRLRPRPDDLWRLLARRPADAWEYHAEPRAVQCAAPPRSPALLEIATCDYNLVRAACIWLGSREDLAVQNRLIELIADRSPVVSRNARFALRYCPDPRVRQLVRRGVTE